MNCPIDRKPCRDKHCHVAGACTYPRSVAIAMGWDTPAMREYLREVNQSLGAARRPPAAVPHPVSAAEPDLSRAGEALGAGGRRG
jgi:hypothetical protein